MVMESFETGSRRDTSEGKPRYDLITKQFLRTLQELAYHSEVNSWHLSLGLGEYADDDEEYHRQLTSHYIRLQERLELLKLASVGDYQQFNAEINRFLTDLKQFIKAVVVVYLHEEFYHVEDILSERVLFELGMVLEHGARHYGEDNWQLGQPFSRYFQSLSRHFFQWRAKKDDWFHFGSLLFNAMALQYHCHREQYNLIY